MQACCRRPFDVHFGWSSRSPQFQRGTVRVARAQRISLQAAISIADTAKQFGQEDDITVVSVQFVGAEIIVNA